MAKNAKKTNRNQPDSAALIPEIDRPLKYKPAVCLLALYFAAVAVRFLLGLKYTHGPVIIIDENLYINIAKSLALEGRLAYRGQPVDYLNIFYPLLLVPLFLFRLPFDLYRVVQLYNAFLITTSVFPVYLFAKDFTGSERKALLSAAVTLLMPDMAMASRLMSECVIWPLTLWVFYFAFRAFQREESCVRSGILAGVFSALLFWTKPGSFAFGIALLAVLLLYALKDKNPLKIRAAACGLATLAGLVALFYAIYVFVFGYDMSVLGLYDKQIEEINALWFAGSAEASVLEVILFVLAAGGIYAVVPFAFLKEYDESRRRFIFASAAGILATAVGTAAFVAMYMWNKSFTNLQLHMRYLAMFVPVMFVFSQPIACRKAPVKKLLILLLAVAALLYIFPGARIGSVKGDSTQVDSMSLNAFMASDKLPAVWGILVTVLCVMTIFFVCMELSRGLSPELKKFCAGYFVLFLLLNNICSYTVGNIRIDSKIAADAMEMNSMVEQESSEILGVTQRYYDDAQTYWLEARIRKPMQQITIDNIIVEADKQNGVYVPFVPVVQAPNVNNGITPDADVFLLGQTIAEHLELSDNVSFEETENGLYTLVHINKGERWLDSTMYGLDKNILLQEKDSFISVYDDSKCDENGNLNITVTAKAKDEGSVLKLSCGGTEAAIKLSDEYEEYTVTLPFGRSVDVKADGGDVDILTYTTGR